MREFFKKWWSKKAVRRGMWAALILLVGAVWWLARPAPKVDVVYPQKRDVVEVVIATGRIQSKDMSTLSAEIAGVVNKLYVEEGARVKRKQKLALLENTDLGYRIQQGRTAVRTAERVLSQVKRKPLQADILQARANVALARSRRQQAAIELERTKRLLRSNTLAQADYDRAKAAYDQAKASELAAKASLQRLLQLPLPEDVSVAQARVRESRAALRTLQDQSRKQTVRAPYDGIIVSRPVAVGQVVAPGTPLFVLASLERIEIVAETDEPNLSKLKLGQSAIVVANAYKQKSFRATLVRISPMVDSQRGVVALYFRPINLPDYALLNMTVDVNVEVGRWNQAISLPISTLIKREGKDYVMVVNDRHTRLVQVDIKGRNIDWIVCESLPMNSKVVLHGNRISEGQKVRARFVRPGARKKRRQ